MFFSRIIWKEILYYSSTFFSGLFKDKVNFSGITQCAFPTIVKSRPRHQLEIMHQSIPAAPTHHPPPPPHHSRLLRSICPPCKSRGGAFANFAQPRIFDRQAVSYQNIPTQRILMEKQADWLICQGEGKIVKACSRFDACISSLLIKPELHCKIGSYRRDL